MDQIDVNVSCKRIQDMSNQQLLGLWADTMDQLQARSVVQTNNSPVGDVAESLVHLHYGGQRGSFSQKSWDLITPDGERIQVKAVRNANGRRRSNLSPIRSADYDSVVIVEFGHRFELNSVIKIPRSVVEEMFPVRAHVNGRIIRIGRPVREHPLTELIDMSEAYSKL